MFICISTHWRDEKSIQNIKKLEVKGELGRPWHGLGGSVKMGLEEVMGIWTGFVWLCVGSSRYLLCTWH
jgi:hypothetical protein